MADAPSIGKTTITPDGKSLLANLGVLDTKIQESAAGADALSLMDTTYSGSNINAAPTFNALADYAAWLKGRGTVVNDNNNLVANPALLGLQDGPLTLALARQNPNPVNVLRALQLNGGIKHAHRPHPGKEAKHYQIKEIQEWLTAIGVFA